MKLKIPATSANMGPGFDTLGLAISLYNYVSITPSSCQSVSIKGEGAKRSKLKVHNLFVSIFYDIYSELAQKKDNFRFEFENNIPFSRGLGSSSAVIVGAIASAYYMANINASKETILNRALFYESHPDNIAPAVYGGFTSSVVEKGNVLTLKKDLPEEICAVVVIPNSPMSTEHSRTLLPKAYNVKEVIFNSSRVGLLCSAFFSENWEYLKIASQDRMHENIRMNKMKELFEIKKISLENNVLMSTLSGSGSSFFNLVYKQDANKLVNNLKKSFPHLRVEEYSFDNIGYEIIES